LGIGKKSLAGEDPLLQTSYYPLNDKKRKHKTKTKPMDESSGAEKKNREKARNRNARARKKEKKKRQKGGKPPWYEKGTTSGDQLSRVSKGSST